VLSAVLVRKLHSRATVGHADWYGLEVDDRYVFGCGMDYKEYFRGLQGIYAVTPP
jgi:hypoxanthine phosphoribosyltransferase